MTCIVGIRSNDGVLLGADSVGGGGYVRRDPKVVSLTGEVAIGYTTSFRMGQLLAYAVTPPPLLPDEDEHRWAVTKFIPEVRKAFEGNGWLKTKDGVEEGGVFLLAVRDRLFTVYGDFQVAEEIADYAACGSGAKTALGALYVLERMSVAGVGPVDQKMARLALRAASYHSDGVGPPFKFVRTRGRQ